MIYIYTENNNGFYGKSAFEIVSFAKQISNKNQQEVIAISINPKSSAEELYKYGANKVIEIHCSDLTNFNAKSYAEVILNQFNGNYLFFSHSNEGVSIAGEIAIKKQVNCITNILSIPTNFSPFTTKRKAFSGKAIMEITSNNSQIIGTITQGSIKIEENPVQGTNEKIEISQINTNTKVESKDISTAKIQLKDAEIVVSAGRGLKAAENWVMIESLANTLNAATACSKPVSDIGWRPHSEHVGQTGKTISPKLYIAVGISGAIQHLAGVNSSQTIVVINNDPEAPFFKSADYGIIGDAFDIIPKLNEALKN